MFFWNSSLPWIIASSVGLFGGELCLDFLSVRFCEGECVYENEFRFWQGGRFWKYFYLVLFSEGFFCLSFVVVFSPLPALPLFYLQCFTSPGEPAESVLGIAWGLSFASYFWQRAMSVRSIFSHSVLSHHASPREENENLITGDFITTFFCFWNCFEEPMHIYHWRHNTVNKYSFQCYIPILCVLTLQLERGWC